MKKFSLYILFLLPPLLVGAQSFRLTKYDAPNALYINTDRLFGFNLYERWNFQASMLWVSPNQNAAQQRKVFGRWTAGGYLGYSCGPKEWKGGVNVGLRLPGVHDVRMNLWAYKDFERAAWRRFGDWTTLMPSSNINIMASRFMAVKGIDFDLTFSPQRQWDIVLGASEKWEDNRFDATGLLYPAIDASQQAPVKRFTEVYSEGKWTGGFRYALYGGIMSDESLHPFFRGITQYQGKIGDSGLGIFAQLGFATEGTPYSRMFDLSGTGGALYMFSNSFLTVRPNTFTANYYAHLCLNYVAPMPLWELSWSKPKPFLQLNAMWGGLLGQDSQGQRHWDGLALQAPCKGLLEPATGFDGLVYWGLIDLGFGVAYQICPLSAPYLNEEPSENIAFVIVANFILDQYK